MYFFISQYTKIGKYFLVFWQISLQGIWRFLKKIPTLESRIVVYTRLVFFRKKLSPICLIRVCTFIRSDKFPKIILMKIGFYTKSLYVYLDHFSSIRLRIFCNMKVYTSIWDYTTIRDSRVGTYCTGARDTALLRSLLYSWNEPDFSLWFLCSPHVGVIESEFKKIPQ